MDTCSRLEEPGGVRWKNVRDDRLRTTISGRRSTWWLRAAARSGRWPRNLACAIPCCGAGWSNVGRPARADGGVAAPHNAGDAAVGGPRGRDRPFAAGERAAAHGARHFKKVDRDLCWSSDMRFRFIEDRRADYPVTILCDVLGVSPAGYYAWRSRPESRRSAANRQLVDDIKRVHRDTRGRYGSPRIHVELNAQGRGLSRGRIERLMRRHGIRAIMARPRRVRHHRQPPRLPDRPEPARAELHRRRAEPDLARRYHLYRDRSGMALSGHRHGPVQPQDRRLGDGGSFARRPAAGSLADGHLGTAAWRRPDPPFRSRRSICLGGVSQGDAVCRLPSLDEPQRPTATTMPRWRASSTRSKPNSSITSTTQHGQKPDVISSLTSKASTIEPVATPPSATSARSRWS